MNLGDLDRAFMLTGDKVAPVNLTDEQALDALAKVLERIKSAPEPIRAQARDLIAEYAITARPLPEATEVEKQARIWGKQKAMHLALLEALSASGEEGEDPNCDHTINVWSRGAERRIYIDENTGGQHCWKATYYLTGNAYHPPGELVLEIWKDSPMFIKDAKQKGAVRDRLIAFCQQVAANWKAIKSDSGRALGSAVEPWQEHLDGYRELLGLEEGADDVVS